MKQWQIAGIERDEVFDVYITKGPGKGTVVTVRKGFGIDLTIVDTRDRLHYSKCELYVNGQILEEPVRDMTGRALENGDWIVYAAGGCLEIGKIKSFGPSGGMTVTRFVQDGVSIKSMNHWEKSTKAVNDPSRALKLPVGETDMVTWVLKDFDNLMHRGD